MSRIHGHAGPSRRHVVAGSVTLAVLASVSPIALTGEARAASWKAFTPHEASTLIRFTRDLFPHDFLDDSAYATALAGLDGNAASDEMIRDLVKAGVADLDARAQAAAGKDFADVADESKRIAILKDMQDTALFQTVYGSTQMALYNEPVIWPKFGFEGPSGPKGGYLHRGFNDLDWL